MRHFTAVGFGGCLLVLWVACSEPVAPAAPPAPAPVIPTEFYKGIAWETVAANGLRYMLTLPAGYEPTSEYPVLLALPPGPQDASMIQLANSAYWQLGKERGWIVVSPEAPSGVLFFDGSETKIPALLDEVLVRHRVEGGRFHLAGISNGGNSAFRVASEHPERFCSLFALPGLPVTEADFQRLDRLLGVSVFLFVGFHDTRWSERMRKTYARLDELGGSARIRILPGVGHALADALPAEAVFEQLEAQRESCRARAGISRADALPSAPKWGSRRVPGVD